MAQLMTYRQYLESDVWKCGESPTGAHHWRCIDEGIFICKYCLDPKRFPISFSQSFNPEEIQNLKEENNVET